jgi:ribosomal protein L19E
MTRTDIRQLVKEELINILREEDEPKVAKATKSDETKLKQAFASMAKRAGGSKSKRDVITQVIKKLASALGSTPNDIAQSFLKSKKDQAATKKSKKKDSE